MKYKIKQFTTYHLVKSEDLNHHGTLFAGRGAEWIVESGFIAAANFINPKNILCIKLDSLFFQKQVKLGDIICFNSRIVKVGKTSLVAYVRVNNKDCDTILVDGFTTFVNVGEDSKPTPHNIELEISCDEDIEIINKLNVA